MAKFVGLRAKTYSYLIDDGSEDKNAKGIKMCDIKRKLKFETYKHCLEETKLNNKIKYLEKNKINIHGLKKNHIKFISNNKFVLKAQQRFKNERHIVFTEEINKIALSSNDKKKCNYLNQ